MFFGSPLLFIPMVFVFPDYYQDLFSRTQKIRKFSATNGVSARSTDGGFLFPTDFLRPSDGNYPHRFDSGNLNDECILGDGQLGICRTFATCASNLLRLRPEFAVNLVTCGRNFQFVCCPEGAKEISTPSGPQSRPQPPKIPKIPPRPKPSLTDPKYDSLGLKPSMIQSISKEIEGIEQLKHKVEEISNQLLPTKQTDKEDEDFYFGNSDPQEICGLFKGNGRKDEELWPWIVSIGKRSKDGQIDWLCLGSLISPKYIVSTARCIEKSPNVVAFGKIQLKRTRGDFVTKPILEQLIKNTNNKQKGTGYQNIGLVRVDPVNVTRNVVPACLPFLGGVLDIIAFANFKNVSTVGYETDPNGEVRFEIEEEKILKNTQCNRVFGKVLKDKKETVNFPLGASHTNMCGMSKKKDSLCQIEGSPLIYFDPASESHVLIGISSGSEGCSMSRRLSVFTRLNSFSSWIRENVGSLPSPLPCYF